jgi:hypothetical protein
MGAARPSHPLLPPYLCVSPPSCSWIPTVPTQTPPPTHPHHYDSLLQVGRLGTSYDKWVHTPSRGHPVMFGSEFIESLTVTHW